MKQIFILALLLIYNFSEAQNAVYDSSKDVFNFGSQKISRNGGILYGFDQNSGELEGSSYADSTWKQGSFLFYPTSKNLNRETDTVAGFIIRYDVYKGEVDILHKKKSFVATTDMLKGFFYKENINVANHYFVNMNDYKGAVEDLKGFAEVLSNGRMKLFKYYYTILKTPDYNPALGVGSKNHKLVQKIDYYYGTGKILQKIESTRVVAICDDVFGDKSGIMLTYSKKQNLNTKKEEDLIRLFNHFNETK